MPKCLIDGKEVEFTPGQNLVELAKKVGISIPVFCYHPGLSVAAQCRMCYVEVEKMPKLQTACSTPAADGMIVKTRSEKVLNAQKGTMEFLLINHPLDCPICDKAGECDLQDNSFGYGDANSRYTEERRTFLDLDMGPVIKKSMNRCIHCTRCIRFGDEIAGIREMVAIQRGNNTEITTIDAKPLQTDYAGNYADICPTGSLTLKDFRFKKRSWFLKKTATTCEGCSRGCSLEVQHESGVVYRCIARENAEVNKFWICDEGRFNYHYLQEKSRITEPVVQAKSNPAQEISRTTWAQALAAAAQSVTGKKALVLGGTDLTNEELLAVNTFAKSKLAGAEIRHFGTIGVPTSAQDADADRILKRKSKTANLHGAEKCGLKPFEDKIPAGVEAILVVRGGRAQLPPTIGPKANSIAMIGIGVFNQDEAKGFSAILPGPGFTEKDGTVVNSAGLEQRFVRAVAPRGASKPISEIFMMWAGNHGK